MVFRLLRAGGQSFSRVALRHLRAVLSSLLLPPLWGCFAFFCALFARRERLETHAGRGFQGGGRGVTSSVVGEHKSGGSPSGLHAC